MIYLIFHITAALLTFAANVYTQLVQADNWPPTHWRRIAWDAVGMLLFMALIAWPFVLYYMHEQIKTYKRRKKSFRKNII